ncbi:MAG: ribokinase [Opitutales bacterium]
MIETSPEVVVVGSYVHDMKWRTDRFPVDGEAVLGDFYDDPGGKGTNQAVAAARLEIPTAFVGGVGRDLLGEGARKLFADEGIVSHLLEVDGPTGTASIQIDASGQNRIVVDLGANLRWEPERIPDEVLAGAKVVVCQCEISPEATEHALRLGREGGAVTILNPAPFSGKFRPEHLRYVDALVPNESEFSGLLSSSDETRALTVPPEEVAGLSDAELSRRCQAIPVPTVIVTLGVEGCFLSGPAGEGRFRPEPGIQAVDTVGAGDSFVGALAASSARGSDWPAAVSFATKVAGLAVQRKGSALAMPRLSEVEG